MIAGTETYVYDDNNRLISETDKNGNTTIYEYEGRYTYPSLTNHPNGAGNLIVTTDPYGNTVSTSYDVMDQFVSETY